MDYKGTQIIKEQKYIFDKIQPYIPEINLKELEMIQNKIENFTSGKCQEGITLEETIKFLDYVIFNARSYAVRNIPESITTASMMGQCAPTQRINTELLSRLGLDVRPFNTSDCIGEIPMNEEDKKRVKNGWYDSIALRHSVVLVSIPIVDENGKTQMYEFLLDPTFRQFCLEENCSEERFCDRTWLEHGHLAPHPGYFMMSENLKKWGESEEIAKNSENLCKTIISRGYFYLSEENAKLYGDAFVRASKRLEFQLEPINMTGQDYIKNFREIPMETLKTDDEGKFTRLPSEMCEGTKSKGVVSKFIEFFAKRFGGNKQELLLSGKNTDTETHRKKSRLESAQLQPDELNRFRTGEREVITNSVEIKKRNGTIFRDVNK